MTYRETLELAKQHNIEPIALEVAYEFGCSVSATDLAMSEHAFELACSKIERAYLKSEYLSVSALTLALLDMLQEQTIDQIDVYDLIDKACYYN